MSKETEEFIKQVKNKDNVNALKKLKEILTKKTINKIRQYEEEKK